VQADRVTLQDLSSSNGTYVNGRRLAEESALAEGDRVVIGETALYLRRARPGADPTPVTSEGIAFCPACGLPLQSSATSCPSCGAGLSGARLPRRSEAPGLGEVLPVGEVLSSGSASWEQTTFRQSVAASAAPGPAEDGETPADPPTEEPPALAEVPMSIRKPERAPVPDQPPPPETGLLQRLAERLGLGRR
jgi:pilus assembly protein CpaF